MEWRKIAKKIAKIVQAEKQKWPFSSEGDHRWVHYTLRVTMIITPRTLPTVTTNSDVSDVWMSVTRPRRQNTSQLLSAFPLRSASVPTLSVEIGCGSG